MHTVIRISCYLASAAALLGAAGYLARGDDKGLGVFLVLIAVILSRVLILNVAIPLEHRRDLRNAEVDNEAGSTESADQSAR